MSSGIEESTRSVAEHSSEVFVPELGLVDLSRFEPSRTYAGKVYRIHADVAKAISDLVAFSARFDLPGIRTACLDLHRTEGLVVFEIERNTKPIDAAVRYMRERWSPVEHTSRHHDTSRPWIKTEYHARFISEKLLATIAEHLNLSGSHASSFWYRINFKDRTAGLIAEERFLDKFPVGAFRSFTLPSAPAAPEAQELTASRPPTAGGTIQGNDPTPQQEADSPDTPQSATADDIADTPTPSGRVHDPADSSSTMPQALTADDDDLKGSALAGSQDMSHQQAASGKETGLSPGGPATSNGPAEPPQQARTEPQRAAEPPAKRKTQDQLRPSGQWREPVETQAKYATYSRSEVDHLLKQQTENITSTLGGKISAQQRAFQEAVDKQDRQFQKLLDGLGVLIENTRTKLDTTIAKSQGTTREELETFRKDLARELDQHRAQVGKIARNVEEKATKAPQERKDKEPPKQETVNPTLIKYLLMGNVALSISILAFMLLVLYHQGTQIEQMESHLQKMLTKSATSEPGKSP